MLAESVLGFEATSRHLEFRGWNFVKCVKGYNFYAKIKTFGVFMKKKWMLELRIIKLYLLLLICE